MKRGYGALLDLQEHTACYVKVRDCSIILVLAQPYILYIET